MEAPHQTESSTVGLKLIQRNARFIILFTLVTTVISVTLELRRAPVFTSQAILKLGLLPSKLAPEANSIVGIRDFRNNLLVTNGMWEGEQGNRPMPRLERISEGKEGDRFVRLVATGHTAAAVDAFLSEVLSQIVKEHKDITREYRETLSERIETLVKGIEDSKKDLHSRASATSPALASLQAVGGQQLQLELFKLRAYENPMLYELTSVIRGPEPVNQRGRLGILNRAILSLVVGLFLALLLAFFHDLIQGYI